MSARGAAVLTVALGPLALPTLPLLMVVATALAAALAHGLARRAGTVLFDALLYGLLAARAAHLLLHAPGYLAEPWTALDIRDGGWFAPAGWLVGGAWVAWQAWRQVAWRRALAAGATLGLLVWGAGGTLLQRQAPQGLPTLALTALTSGRSVDLRTLAAGAPLVVNLWATWCGPCRREMPVLAQAQAEHPGVRFVFVNQGESAATVQRYLAAEGLVLREVLLDPASAAGPALGSGGLPTTVFFDAAGRRVHAHVGGLNAAALRARLGALPLR